VERARRDKRKNLGKGLFMGATTLSITILNIMTLSIAIKMKHLAKTILSIRTLSP
jgi:hypothetical protein